MCHPGCFKEGCYLNCPHKCDWKIGRLPGYEEQQKEQEKKKEGLSNFLKLILHI